MDNQVLEVVPTKKCGNCEQEIEAPKFRMHEVGCLRNNIKCKVCGEIVAKEEKEEHDNEAHKKVQCQHCSIEFDKRSLAPHVESCFMKPKGCKFCEQTLKFEEYDKHIGYCGSKT